MRLLYLLIVLILSVGCSPTWHYNKAVNKGLEITQESDTIRITTIDSIPIIKHDTIVYEHFYTSKDTVIFYKNVSIPKTIREIRIENKLIRDTIRIREKAQVSIEKQKTKQSKTSPFLRFVGRMWWLILIIGIALGTYLRGLLPF